MESKTNGLRRKRPFMTALVVVGLVAGALLVPAALAGGAPSIAFDSPSQDYGTIDPGATASHTFVLTNSGSAATGAITVTLSGSPAFTKTADTCTDASLGPRKSCSVTVQYAPTTAGANDNASLTATSKKPATAASASLTGASTKSQSQLDCESYGGTFAPGPDPKYYGTTLWECIDWTVTDDDDFTTKFFTLSDDCWADGGNTLGASKPGADLAGEWFALCSLVP